jgi:hypothetical protein
MARFYGKVGYGVSEETVPGVWSEKITERAYYGDILNDLRSTSASEKVNDDVRLQHRISIVAEAFSEIFSGDFSGDYSEDFSGGDVLENYLQIKYVEWAGFLWTVNSVDVERPRLILSLGGVYNGPRPEVVVP